MTSTPPLACGLEIAISERGVRMNFRKRMAKLLCALVAFASAQTLRADSCLQWQQRRPAACYGTAMVHDSNRGVTVLFGGTDGDDYLNETWEWDGQIWALRSTS